MKQEVKKPNISGTFYPDNSDELKSLVLNLLDSAHSYQPFKETLNQINNLKALIAPHAGLIYSGPIAASAYTTLKKINPANQSIAIFSPTHFFDFKGIAGLNCKFYNTPLGQIPINQSALEKLFSRGEILLDNRPFEKEHALEIQLPFLQVLYPEFDLLPFIVGQTTPDQFLSILNYCEENDIFPIVSTDLSHFHTYNQAKKIDHHTSQLILHFNYQDLQPEYACGYYPLNGLLNWAMNKDFIIKKLDLRNSGDTSGEYNKVVGYGAFAISQR